MLADGVADDGQVGHGLVGCEVQKAGCVNQLDHVDLIAQGHGDVLEVLVETKGIHYLELLLYDLAVVGASGGQIEV